MVLHFFIISVLGIIVFQDFSSRSVSIFLFPLLFIFLFLSPLHAKPFQMWIWPEGLLPDILYLALIIGGTVLYLRWKLGQWPDLFKDYFGFGDLLFLCAIVPFFFLHEFIVFTIAGFITAIVSDRIIARFAGRPGFQTIPLAGVLAVCFGCWYGIKLSGL